MLKSKHFAFTAAVLAALGPGSLAMSRTIDISGSPTLEAWSGRVFQHIDDHMTYPASPLNRVNTGVVAVKFNCSETGAPIDVALYKSSGSRNLDEATLRALRRVATLHPLPVGMTHGQKFVVRVLFADSPAGAERQMDQLRAEARKNNEWFGKGAPALGGIVELIPPRG